MDKIFGIDISTWQGGMNLAKAKREGVKFAIIRAGFTGSSDGISKAVDNQFENHYKNAKANGLGVGAYWFSRATSYEKGKEEAEYMYNNCLKGKQFDYPIAIDVEDTKYQSKVNRTAITEAIKGFCEYLEQKGYYVSIYSSVSWFKNKMNLSDLERYDKWVAYWGTEKSSIEGGLWQFGGETNYIRSNIIAGMICDQNYAYKNYPTIIKNNGLNGYSKEEPQPEPAPIPTKEFNIGDDVIISGALYKSSDAEEPSGYIKYKETTITRKVDAKHPYNTTGDLGWIDASSITLIEEKEIEYIVQSGDTLSGIASKYNTTWQKIYEDNKDVIGDNPNLIKPGQKLIIKD